ncbi:MAG: nucleoside 2-deoxyribosyltransferase [Candidatus Diapherotrites archaeon]|nr:nucleoside 2-deoxyribosyltransferase [Candidatus Diapherotrites archaeon]
MRIFLAGPFTAKICPDEGAMRHDDISLVQGLISLFEVKGHEVFSAHRREDYGRALLPPHECTQKDYEEMKSCDIVVAHPGNPPSGGVHIELGWASVLGKPSILLLEHGKDYSPLVHGLGSLSEVEYIHFKDHSDLFQKLETRF